MDLEKGSSLNMSVRKKYYFYALSICIWICEVSVIVWGAIVLQHVENINRIAFWKNVVSYSLVALFIIGSILTILALFGGGFSVYFFKNERLRSRSSVHNSCMVKVLIVLFLVMMILQASMAISMLIATPAAEDDFKEAFKDSYGTRESNFINDIQRNLNCSGIYSYRDYFGNEIPISCCSNILQPISRGTQGHVQLTQCCVFALNNAGFTLVSKICALSTFILIITVLEFIGFVVTLCLMNAI